MVGSYCVHRVELDTETEDTLAHAWAQKEDHKYIARVEVKNPKNPKRKWLYFYSRERYEAYLRRESKPGDVIELPNGQKSVVSAETRTLARKNAVTAKVKAVTSKLKSVDKGRSLLSRLFGGGDGPSQASEGTGSNVVADIFAKLAAHRAKREAEGDPVSKAINNFADAVRAKADANKKAEADKRAAAANKPKPAVSQTSHDVAPDDDDDKKKGKGGGGGGGSGKGSGSGKAGKANNATSYGSVSKLPKIKGDHTPDQDMAACDGPHDSSNCITYDLRRRGYNVKASDTDAGDINAVASLYKGAQVAEEKDFNRLVTKLSKLKVGARGIMQFGNRMVIWSVEKNGITFRDCTNGKVLDQTKLAKGKKSFKLIRTDNCSPSDKTLSAVNAG